MTTANPDGPTIITRMIASGVLERVPASRHRADLLMAQAEQHLASSRLLAVADPEGAYALLYDAVRKALTAVLEDAGVRTTSRPGHHKATHDAVAAFLRNAEHATLRPFERMRLNRAAVEYPREAAPALDSRNVLDDHGRALRIVALCGALLTDGRMRF